MKEFDKLKEIIDTLRSPNGCPWDRKQTHDSLLSYLYEESNEVGDAIIKGDLNHLKEELGDLLLQIMLHARIAEESAVFNINDVVALLNEKLIRRHPHVFSDAEADNSNEVKKLWESIKAEERKHKEVKSVLDEVPNNFSPLLRSYKLQKAASKVGFDWEDKSGVLDKIEEEIHELREALEENDNIEHVEHELGDLFFALVNLGKFLGLKSDIVLSKANNRFINRFQYVEKRVAESDRKFSEYSLSELDAFWEEAKQALKE